MLTAQDATRKPEFRQYRGHMPVRGAAARLGDAPPRPRGTPTKIPASPQLLLKRRVSLDLLSPLGTVAAPGFADPFALAGVPSDGVKPKSTFVISAVGDRLLHDVDFGATDN